METWELLLPTQITKPVSLSSQTCLLAPDLMLLLCQWPLNLLRIHCVIKGLFDWSKPALLSLSSLFLENLVQPSPLASLWGLFWHLCILIPLLSPHFCCDIRNRALPFPCILWMNYVLLQCTGIISTCIIKGIKVLNADISIPMMSTSNFLNEATETGREYVWSKVT